MKKNSSDLSDLDVIIKGCLNGDRRAQAALYNLYSRQMFGICLWYARSRPEAEEILQDGFIRVFKYIATYAHKAPFEQWLRRIMINAALRRYRGAAGLHKVQPLEESQYAYACEDEVLGNLEKKDLLKLVQELSPGYRMVFNLFVIEGMKHREIAVLLGISEGTSKSNLSDARMALQKKIYQNKLAVPI